jgi:hypothetical protein
MNIIHIIPGSGGSFYCGNCLRDSKLFDAIRAEGHDAIKVPMYLPSLLTIPSAMKYLFFMVPSAFI